MVSFYADLLVAVFRSYPWLQPQLSVPAGLKGLPCCKWLHLLRGEMGSRFFYFSQLHEVFLLGEEEPPRLLRLPRHRPSVNAGLTHVKLRQLFLLLLEAY